MSKLQSCLVLLALMLAARPADAQLPGFPGDDRKTGEQLVPVRALTDVAVVHPGQTFHVAAVFDIEPGWHIYWMSAGASGLPTHVELDVPPGFTVGKTRFPRPKTFRGEEGISFGYDRQTALFVPVTAPAELPDGEVRFKVSASWLVCKKACMMGSAERTVTVRTTSAAGGAPGAGDVAKVLGTYAARLPRRFEDLEGASLGIEDGTLVISGPAGGLEQAVLFPVEVPGVTYGAPKVSVKNDRFTVRVPVTLKPANARGKPMSLRGVIALGKRADDPSYEFNRQVAADGTIGANP